MAQVFNRQLADLESKPLTAIGARNLFAGDIVNHGGTFERSNKKDGTLRESRNFNIVNGLVTLFQRGDGNKGETRADALNAITQRHTRGDADSNKDVWTMFESGEFGTSATRKAEFLSLVTDDDATAAAIETGRKALVASGLVTS